MARARTRPPTRPRAPAPTRTPAPRPHAAPRGLTGPVTTLRAGVRPGGSTQAPAARPRARVARHPGGVGAPPSGPPLSAEQIRVAGILLGVGHRLHAPTPALEAIIYAALGETNLGENPRTYMNNGVGYWGVLQGDMPSWPDPHDIAGQALAFYTGRGPQGQTDFHVGAINWVHQGVTFPPEIAVRTEVPSIWPNDAYANNAHMTSQALLDHIMPIYDEVSGSAVPVPSGGGGGTPSPNVPQVVVSGNLYQMMTQLDYAGLDINLWKELDASVSVMADSAHTFLRHVQKTTFVTPHKAG